MPKLKTASKKPQTTKPATAKKPTDEALTDAWIEKGVDAHWREVWNRALEMAPRRSAQNADRIVVAHAIDVLTGRTDGMNDPTNTGQWTDWWLDDVDLGVWPKEALTELMQTIARLAPPAERKAFLGSLMQYTANELRFSVAGNRAEQLKLDGKSNFEAEQQSYREVGITYGPARDL